MAGLAELLPVVIGMRPEFGEAVWKRSGISVAADWVLNFHPLISGLPIGFWIKRGKKARLGLHDCFQFPNSNDLHEPFHVVGKNMRAHLGTDPFQGPGQEMGAPPFGVHSPGVSTQPPAFAAVAKCPSVRQHYDGYLPLNLLPDVHSAP